MKNIVIYGNEVDKRAAEYLADFLNCAVIHKDNIGGIYKIVDNIYMVGGNFKPTNNTILISGSDRYETIKAVLKFIGKL